MKGHATDIAITTSIAFTTDIAFTTNIAITNSTTYNVISLHLFKNTGQRKQNLLEKIHSNCFITQIKQSKNVNDPK